jgi:hypothetical protein
MSNQSSSIPPVLEIAWKRFADYDNTAESSQDQYYLLRRWVLYFSIIATFLAIVVENFRTIFPEIIVTALQVILIAVPIAGSVLIAFLSEFKQGQKYLAMRAGAEEIKKEIYLYRTVMQTNPNRKKWLNKRVAEIQRQVHRSLGGQVVVKPYTGEYLNPYYDPNANYPTDQGYDDLDGEEYITLRVEDQLAWHIRKIQSYQTKRKRLIILILIAGGIGSLLAGIDFILNGIAIWVALATAISSAITNWKEVLGLDITVPNYSKVILELNILLDHWKSLEPYERTQAESFRIVRATEKLLWSQNTEYISAMRESMDEAEAKQEKMVEDMIEMSQEVAGRVQEQIIEEARRSMEEAAQAAAVAAGQSIMDGQRMPVGTIFNAALGPAEAVIIGEGEEDAPDGFEDNPETSDTVDSAETEVEELFPDDEEDEDGDDPVLAAINTAVSAAIEESDAVKSSNKKKTPEDLDDLAAAAQDAADKYIQNAADSFADDKEQK